MLNLNKSKIMQYLIDFMIVRKNCQLDLLNFNYETSMAPSFQNPYSDEVSSSLFSFNPKANVLPNERRSRPNEIAYVSVNRGNPIYKQSGNFEMRLKNVVEVRMAPKMSCKFDKRPFDNNILNGRRIARRIVKTAPRDERISQMENLQNNQILKPVQPAIQQQVIESNPVIVQKPSPIVASTIILDNDTPPLSDVSSTNSSQKVKIISNDVVHPAAPTIVENKMPNIQEQLMQVPRLRFSLSENENKSLESNLNKQIQTGHITLEELRTLSQNGTEIIPTNFIRVPCSSANEIHNTNPLTSMNDMRKLYDRQNVQSHEEAPPKVVRVPRMPMRRKSCHERIINNESSIKNNQIAEHFQQFLNEFEQREKKMLKERKMKEILEMRKASTENFYTPEMKKARYENNNPVMYLQHQPQLSNNHVLNPYIAQSYTNARRKPPARAPLIDYQYYSDQYQRQMREHGYNQVDNNNSQPQPMEIVSNIPPEHYANNLQQANNHHPASILKHSEAIFQQQKPQHHQQPQRMLQQDFNMRASIAIQQLQELHRDPSNLPPQKYAEHLKQMENLKNLQRLRDEQQQMQQHQLQQQHQQNQQLLNRSKGVIHSYANNNNIGHHIEDYSRKEPNYEYDETQNLQKKLKFKSRSSSIYVEPSNQAQVTSKPIVVNQNPPHSTYYSDPQIRNNKSSTASSPNTHANGYYFVEENGTLKSPLRPAPSRDHLHQQQIAPPPPQHHQIQSHAPTQPQPWQIRKDMLQRTTQLMQSHMDLNITNGSSHAQHIHNQNQLHYNTEQHPTQFLRAFYGANNGATNVKKY